MDAAPTTTAPAAAARVTATTVTTTMVVPATTQTVTTAGIAAAENMVAGAVAAAVTAQPACNPARSGRITTMEGVTGSATIIDAGIIGTTAAAAAAAVAGRVSGTAATPHRSPLWRRPRRRLIGR